MRPYLIKGANCLLLILVLIGIPAVAEIRIFGLQVSPATTLQRLVLWGLLLGVAANAATTLFWAKDRKNGRLCCEWAIAFACLYLVELALSLGYLNFHWLKQTLLWIK
jgi:hypothetical protein